jgi:hypothetical protein
VKGSRGVKTRQSDEDSPWKEILERYFVEFLAFFFPEAHAAIAWEKGHEFLDKELQKVVRDAKLGKRLADKLVKVHTRDGVEAWVLVHIEIQGQVDKDFPRRMYVYNYRLFDRYDRRVASLAVLTDHQPHWRPSAFGYELWGCRVGLEFPVVKLLDYKNDLESLEANPNPFALVVMAHLQTHKTRQKAKERLQGKLALVRMLYERGYAKQDILELFRFIDWVLVLPEELETEFAQSVIEYEETAKMPYVTSVERVGIKKGIQQGIQQGEVNTFRQALIEVLIARFGELPSSLISAVNGIADPVVLRKLLKLGITSPSPEAFEKSLQASS